MMLAFPIKLNDNYTCQGHDANGDPVVFDDLLYEGQLVGSELLPDGSGDSFPPYGRVVRREDGLWVERA